MFGYVLFNQPELKFREYDLYRSYYCGLCHTLHRKFHVTGQMTLSYDSAFLGFLLTSLYEPATRTEQIRCIPHPLKKHPACTNEYIEYAADMNIILSYYSMQDNWEDEHRITGLLFASLLRGNQQKAALPYEEKIRVIRLQLSALHRYEKENSPDLDAVSNCFGFIMAEIFAVHHDEWESVLRKMGFYLGKFIYILDAFDDLKKDAAKGNYNPFLAQKDDPDLEQQCRQILTMIMAECCSAFETLPILENVNILRNILYSGVWTGFENAVKKRNGEKTDV